MSIYDFVLLCTQDEYKIILSDMAAEDPMPDAEMTVEEARESDHPALYMELEAWDYADDGRLILYYDSEC